MSYATDFKRQALLFEIERLRPRLPQTESALRCAAAIERSRPLKEMDENELCNYLNLFVRSIEAAKGEKP